jgi:hypothetical protein
MMTYIIGYEVADIVNFEGSSLSHIDLLVGGKPFSLKVE